MFLALTPHYASDYSIFMALVDLIPVIFFFLAGLILLRDLYNKLSKVSYSLLSSGVIMVLIAGLLKAVWKIMCALNICDFVVFNLMMMPVQGIGFLLASISLFNLFKKDKSVKAYSFSFAFALLILAEVNEAPLEFTNSSVPFLVIQTLGGSIMLILLTIIAFKMNYKPSAILFIVSFITMWGMGALAATQNMMSTVLWNWLEEIDNSISQGTLLAGVYLLSKNGLAKEKIF